MKKYLSLIFILLFLITGCRKDELSNEHFHIQTQLRDAYVKSGPQTTGVLKWGLTTNSKINSSPAIDGHVVVFVNTDGIIYALNSINGSKVWSSAKKLPTTVDEASVEIERNLVFIAGENGVLYALNLSIFVPLLYN